jgi:hypothetical protein
MLATEDPEVREFDQQLRTKLMIDKTFSRIILLCQLINN